MATTTAAAPRVRPINPGAITPSISLWKREIVRFYRQKARVVGVILSPLLFWIVIGSGFGSSFRGENGGGQHYLDFFFPGALTMIVLFTSIFTMMSVIEDRNEGFLLSVLVAPVSRSVIVLGKVLGGTTLAAIQGLIFLVFAPLIGVHFTLTSFLLIVLTSLPGGLLVDSARLRDRVADGLDPGLPRHHQPVPDSALATFGIALPGQQRVEVAQVADAHQPAYLRDRGAPGAHVSG